MSRDRPSSKARPSYCSREDWWICDEGSNQEGYVGCCKIDPCRNGGVCPRGMEVEEEEEEDETTTLTTRVTRTETRTKTRTWIPTETSTDLESGSETETTSYETPLITTPVRTTFLTETTTHTSPSPTFDPHANLETTSSDNKSALIGGAVGGVLGAVVLILLTLFFIRRHRQLLKAASKSPILGGAIPRESSTSKRPNSDPDPAPLEDMYAGMTKKHAPDNNNNDNNNNLNPVASPAGPKSTFSSGRSTLVASQFNNSSPSLVSWAPAIGQDPIAPRPSTATGDPGPEDHYQLYSTPELPGSVPLPCHVVSELTPSSARPPEIPAMASVDLDMGDLSPAEAKRRSEQVLGHGQGHAQRQERASTASGPGPSLTITTPEGVVMRPNLHSRQDAHVMSFMHFQDETP